MSYSNFSKECNSKYNNEYNEEILRDAAAAKEVVWVNPHYAAAALPVQPDLNPDLIDQAGARLRRFAPVLMHYFPETTATGGVLESPLTPIPQMQRRMGLEGRGRLFLKRDSDLAVAGSVKARGGIYEVLAHTESLALEAGLLDGPGDDYMKLTTAPARDFFASHRIQVGSTGNLGLSIGIMSAALGYHAIVHMSADAKQWKKDLLRSHGAEVIEYSGDYGAAVAEGRRLSDLDPMSYFVDDEKSVDLFLGYATAARHLKGQLAEAGLTVDSNHPLWVYIPCGVGGAPGGITYGLKREFGDDVVCVFAEPVQAPCMLLGLASGRMNQVSVQDFGLTGVTAADGLACGRCSGLSAEFMDTILYGESTVDDCRLPIYMKQLWQSEGIFIEPSSCAAFHPVIHFAEDSSNAIHLVWATGGSLMPSASRGALLND